MQLLTQARVATANSELQRATDLFEDALIRTGQFEAASKAMAQEPDQVTRQIGQAILDSATGSVIGRRLISPLIFNDLT